MKRIRGLAGTSLLLLALACCIFGAEKKSKGDSIVGTWDCVAHLNGEDDIPFSMKLEQSGETVTGSITTHDGELEISSGSFKNDSLELHIETSEAKYLVTGKLEGGQFKGHWSKEPDGMQGDWEGKKSAQAQPPGQ